MPIDSAGELPVKSRLSTNQRNELIIVQAQVKFNYGNFFWNYLPMPVPMRMWSLGKVRMANSNWSIRTKWLVAGENESPSRIWTTTNSLVPFAITMIRISWRRFTANAMRTSSTSMVYINWINLNCLNHLTRNINKKWCAHHTRRISNGVHSVRPQRRHRRFTCRIIITIPPLRWLRLRLLTATTGIIPVPTIMRRISPLRIRISRHPIGSVQPQVQHRQAPVDCQRQAQHRRLFHPHYPIEREKESRDKQPPIVLLYTKSFSFFLSFCSELKKCRLTHFD